MCPKRKADTVQSIRLELQESEREALDMVAASQSFKNVSQGVGSLIAPILGMSTTGMIALTALGLFMIDRSVSDMERQIAEDPSKVPTQDIITTTLWNLSGPATLKDLATKGPEGIVAERVTYGKELSSRGWSWVKESNALTPWRVDYPWQ